MVLGVEQRIAIVGPLAALAIERPEWGGHKRVLLPPLSPSRADQLDIREAEILVIGAGIVGLCCTEFGMLLSEDESFPVIDSTKANVRALLAA